MKTQIAVFMAMLIVAGLFTTGLALAEEGQGKYGVRASAASPVSMTAKGAVSLSELESETSIDAAAKADIESEDNVPKTWRSFPAKGIYGNGWAVDENNNAYFATLLGVSRDYVDSETSISKTIVKARLKIGNDNYKLVSTETNVAEANTMSFNVMDGNRIVGTFSLTTSETFENGMQSKKGMLSLDSGASYDVTMLTATRAVKSTANDGSNNNVPTTAKRWWQFWKARSTAAPETQ